MKYMILLLVLAVAAQAQYPYYYGAYAPNVYSGVIPSTYTTYTAPIPAAPVATRISAPAVVTSYAAPIPVAPAVTSTQYHSQDELGQASFGYAHPGQAATNYRDAFGNQVGSYAYINPEGKQVQVSYVADSNGFRVLSNDLPVGPVAQEIVELESPVPVEDTAEVVEAKAIHFKAIEDAKNGVVAPLPVVEAVELPQSVEDTPEVAAAKAEHAAAYAAALAAANASPVEDSPIEVAVETAPAVVEDAPAEVAVEAVPSETVVEDAPVEIAVVSAPAEAELPKPVEDTPEVAAAKIEHAAAHAAALAAAEASPALERRRRQIPFYPFPYFAASQRGADYAWRSVDADKDGQPDVPAVVSYVAPVVPAMTYTIPNTPFRYYN